MNSPHTDRSDANAVHWVRLVQRMAPSLTFWMFTSVVAAGVMLYTCRASLGFLVCIDWRGHFGIPGVPVRLDGRYGNLRTFV